MRIASLTNRNNGAIHTGKKEIEKIIADESGHEFFNHLKIVRVTQMDTQVEMVDLFDCRGTVSNQYTVVFST